MHKGTTRAGSPRTVSAGASVGRVSHPGRPCRRLCLCSCCCRPPTPLPAWGGQEEPRRGSGPQLALIKNVTPPSGPGPCEKPARSWGKAQSLLCSWLLKAGAPRRDRVQRAGPRLAHLAALPAPSPAPPAGGPVEGGQQAPNGPQGALRPWPFLRPYQ